MAKVPYNQNGTKDLPEYWREATKSVGYDSTGSGGPTDFKVSGGAYRTFVNDMTGEAVIAYKGSDFRGSDIFGIRDWIDDLNPFSMGAKTYDTVSNATRDTIKYLEANNIDRSDIYTVGHSLGGALAQSAALQFGLSGYGFDSLPISKTLLSRFEAWSTPDELISNYRQNHTFIETNTGGDIATTLYSNVLGRSYLDANPTTLNSGVTNRDVFALVTLGMVGGWAPAALEGLGIGFMNHMTDSYSKYMNEPAQPAVSSPNWTYSHGKLAYAY